MDNPRVLIVDDEQSLIDLIRQTMGKEGIRDIQTAQTGKEAIEKCRTYHPHAIVLDVMLTDITGFDVCREIRKFTDAPILFLTAKSSDLDKLLGFGLGGDDYITKPFNPLEVVARIKAHLRRQLTTHSTTHEDNRIFDFGRFKVHENAALLEVHGQPLACPAREFQLLLFLCKHPNHVFSKDQLYEQVWGEHSLGDDNTVMVHIRRLREKIELDASTPQHLCTVRGLGYKFTAVPSVEH